MRITINNFANTSMANVCNALFDMDTDIINEFKSYASVYNYKNIQVYYRKTKAGYAIDLHKIKK